MPIDRSRIYEDGPLPALLRHEQAMLSSILDGVFGVWGLHLRPHREAPNVLPAHLLSSVVNLASNGGGSLEGDARCQPQHLPFASESFKLVVAQHILEQAPNPEEIAEELGRVLAAEGIALIFGFNPASLWRPWLAGRLPETWQFSAASRWRDVLSRSRLDVLQVRYSGLWSPWARALEREEASPASPTWQRPLGRFCGSWLLLARKRRSALTPLRLAAVRADLKLNPNFVPGAHRECA